MWAAVPYAGHLRESSFQEDGGESHREAMSAVQDNKAEIASSPGRPSTTAAIVFSPRVHTCGCTTTLCHPRAAWRVCSP